MTPGRRVVFAAWAFVGAAIVLPLLLLSAMIALAPYTSDFMCFWTGSRFVLEGRDPYDAIAWTEAMSGEYVDAFGQVRGTFCPGRYGYPLTTAIVLLPLGALPIEIAAPIWQALLVVGAVAGTVLVWRALDGPSSWLPYLLLLVLASQPLWNTVRNAQFGGLLLGTVGLVVYLIARHRFAAAGAAAVLLLLKPHITGPVLFGTWSRRTWRPAITSIVVASLLFAVSLVAQPGWPLGWSVELSSNRIEATSSAASGWTLASWLPGGRIAALAIIGVLSLAALALARRTSVTATEAVAVLACLTLVITPYSGSHDQVVLVPAWAIVLRRSLERGDQLLLVALPLLAVVLPWALFATRGLSGGVELSAVIPVLASVVLLATLHRYPRPPVAVVV